MGNATDPDAASYISKTGIVPPASCTAVLPDFDCSLAAIGGKEPIGRRLCRDRNACGRISITQKGNRKGKGAALVEIA
jgi:hypothetical protein